MGVPGKYGNEREVTEMTGKEWEHQRSDGAREGRNVRVREVIGIARVWWAWQGCVKLV